MTKRHSIPMYPEPPREKPCREGCTTGGIARLMKNVDAEGVQCLEYGCGYTMFHDRWGEERYYDCMRCGRPRRGHIKLADDRIGEALLCPDLLERAEYVMGMMSPRSHG